MRIIEHEGDISDGIAWLLKKDRRLKPVFKAAGMPPLRRSAGGFEGLCHIIVSQQLSVASANSIWNRVKLNMDPFAPDTVLGADEAKFRICGLSAPKIRTLRAIAESVDSNDLHLEKLHEMPAEDAHSHLIQVKGIGPWTADIYLMFCLGHADAFAAGDLALQEAIRIAFDMESRPTAAELHKIAEKWRPWRAVAARLLWSYYKVAKSREGVT